MEHSDLISIIIIFSSLFFYVYLIDPFKWKSRNRNHYRLLENDKYFKASFLIGAIIFLTGLIKIFFNDKNTIAFSSIPLLFIMALKIANAISLKRDNRKFFLLLRGDSLKQRAGSDILASILVTGLPILIPIIYLLVKKSWNQN